MRRTLIDGLVGRNRLLVWQTLLLLLLLLVLLQLLVVVLVRMRWKLMNRRMRRMAGSAAVADSAGQVGRRLVIWTDAQQVTR